MKFKKDQTGVLDKVVAWTIKKYRPDLECISFLCVWRDKEKFCDGRLVMAEVSKINNKNRDVFGYDVMLEVDCNAWKTLNKKEKKRLIFHELEHVKVHYELLETQDNTEEIEVFDSVDKEKEKEQGKKTAQEIFETMLADEKPFGEPTVDKNDRIVVNIIPHSIVLDNGKEGFYSSDFFSEIRQFGLSNELEGLRLFLNHIKKTVGLEESREE